MGITEQDVRDHVGPRAMRRVKWYDVDEPVAQGSTIEGRVAGFHVQVVLDDPLSSTCTCLYRQRCDHVAVLLSTWLHHPDRFATRQALGVELPSDPTSLQAFLEDGHAVLLDEPVERFLPGRLPLGHGLHHRELDRLSTVLADGVDVAPLLPALTAVVERRMRRRRAVEAAQAWRLSPPEEPELVALYESCRAVLAPTDLEAAPGKAGRVELGEEEQLVFRTAQLPQHPIVVPIQADLLRPIGGIHRRQVAAIALDSIIGSHAPEVRRAVLNVLQTPMWQRSLAQLDAALARVGPREDRSIGWRVKSDGIRITGVEPVQLTPYKRRSGYRTRKLAPAGLAELPRAADRAALGALRSKAAVGVVLEQLVDHPLVVDDAGQLLRVRRTRVEVVVREAAGWSIEVRIDGSVVEGDQLTQVEVAGSLGVLRLGQRICLFEIEPAVHGLFAMLARYGGQFPLAARRALIERLQVLEQVVPLQIEGSLQGTRVEPDLTPELRLIPLEDGALRVELGIQPLPGGPLQLPGEGPIELSHVVDGTRRFVHRDLRRERASVADVLDDLPLPVIKEGAGTLDDPNDALELVWQLRQRTDVRVVWPQRRWTVRRSVRSLRVGLTRRRDWFGVSVEDDHGEKVSLKALLAAVRARQQFVAVDDRAWLRITVELQEALKLAAALATDEDEPRLPPLAASRALLALESAALTVDLPDELRDLEGRIRAAQAIRPSLPKDLNATLRPYQLDGLTWLRRVSAWAPGAVLADEMGLGKTLQALALALDRGGRTLVVAPASVNFNWAREAERFTPTIPVHLYRGSERSIEGEHGLWITSYELLVRDAATLSEIPFDTVIYDEAHALKNPLTQRSRAARSLNPGFVLALTGTPVENHLLELWSLLRVVAPGLLGPREHFLSRYGQPLMEGEQLGEGRLSQLLQPFLLRRTKAAVAPELPPRVESVELVELSSAERVIYERFRRAAVGAIGSGSERMAVLAALTRLRQIACAAHLVEPSQPPVSAKLARLVERVVEAQEAGIQVLVFSQFTRLLDLADQALRQRGLRTLQLDGRTPVARRRDRVDAFQAGEADAFLIALKAGGTGLNLTAANLVILLDPWWNPAVEDQASDRAHRIGQTAQVHVVRLVTAGTVEEQVLALHDEKRRLAEAVFDEAGHADRLSADDLIALLSEASVA